jgi:hypothetical protein
VKPSSESATVKAAAAKATHASAVEATATTKAAPMSASTSTAATSTAARLRTRREQRPGKEGGRQQHHRFSSSHESFLSMGRAISDHHRTSRPGQHLVARLRIANGKFRRQ